MTTRNRLVISNGTVANDGTGDTLYDATTKINNNFEMLWYDLYQGVAARQRYIALDSNPPADPFEGEMWLDTKTDTMMVYDGLYWFEFPSVGSSIATLHYPGRNFELEAITDSSPEFGYFTMTNEDLSETSNANIRISSHDKSNKSFMSSSNMGTISSTKLSMWTKTSGGLDDWELVCSFRGSAVYETDHWNFSIDSSFATGNLDSDETYYISLDGVW